MSELQTIESALSGVARRRRWAAALRGLWIGLLTGALISLFVDGVYHLSPLPFWTRTAAALAPFPCSLAGLILGGWRRLGMAEAARWVDGREHLKERLSTALEVASQPTAGAWRDLVIADAARHAGQLDPRRIVPFGLPGKVARWALVALALGAGLGFVPEYRTQRFLQSQTDRQLIREAGRQLADLSRRTLQARQPALEPRAEKALETLSDLGDRLNKATLTRGDALKDIANVSERLKDELRDLAKDPVLNRLEQAARSSGAGDSQSAAGLQKQIDSLQKQLGAPTGNPQALEKLSKDLDKLRQAAKGLDDKNSPAGQQQRNDISKALSALSRQAQEMGLQMPHLNDAINALDANQTELFLKDLQASVTDLDKLNDMAKTLQQLQQQMDKLGKDLAEQLKNGQPEAAQKTLEKMASQLTAANLPPGTLQNIAAEVAKAVGPAGHYGSLAGLLGKAGKQLAASDKAGASRSLSDAAKELERLAQQMGDAQSIAAELQALNQVAAAIASGKEWRPGNRPGRSGLGEGGGTGGGVGTWADENAEWNGQWSDHWDNTGFDRDDQDARGHTDRGEGDLSAALKPSKVRGQFSPGNPMPSVTLRNVSIKGQSKLDYEAAAATAQSDAQSALTHEQVPRAYQGAVREYFDDLKK